LNPRRQRNDSDRQPPAWIAAAAVAGAATLLTLGATASGCGAETDTVPAGDGGASSDASGEPADGGDSSTPSSSGGQDADGAPRGGCTTDADCNEDPTVDTLWGKCFRGACFCNGDRHLQPSGKCAPKVPAACGDQGGHCLQEATCSNGEIGGTQLANMGCGDFVAAVCCFAPAACRGPDFVCCANGRGERPVVCENGWRTCAEGDDPAQVCR
jgi:hypothetical protein